MDGESLYKLLESECCTMSAGVPTIFTALLTYLRETRRKLTTLKLITIGGAACPPLLLKVLCSVPCMHLAPQAGVTCLVAFFSVAHKASG